jgi:Protein of unknown function (DUF3465)
MKRAVVAAVAFALLASIAYLERHASSPAAPHGGGATGDAVLGSAFRNRVSRIEVEGQGTVEHILPDDNDGSRHQRFILRLNSGQEILIAHNIDVAPRLRSLRVGDVVRFKGEYDWNDKGGVIHWTHRDPAGRHQAGWLKQNEASAP